MAVTQRGRKRIWDVRVSYKDEHGKYRTKSKYGFKSSKEAILWEEKTKAQLEGGYDNTADIPFSEMFLNWYETFKEMHIEDSTKSNYKATYNKIKAFFKRTPINKVTRRQYQTFLNEYGEDLSKGTMRKTHRQIRGFVKDCLTDNIINNDFTYKAKIIGKPPKSNDEKFLSEGESKQLLKSILNGINHSMTTRYMIALALATGMRFGEVVGLTYDCFDFNENTINIYRAWDYKDNKGFRPLKNEFSVRKIRVEESVMKLMQSYIIKQKKLQLSRKLRNPNNLVFAKLTGLTPSNEAANDALGRACMRAKVPVIAFHGLRHTHISLLIYSGMKYEAIAKRVGHKNAATTIEAYAHVIKELEHQSDEISDSMVEKLFN